MKIILLTRVGLNRDLLAFKTNPAIEKTHSLGVLVELDDILTNYLRKKAKSRRDWRWRVPRGRGFTASPRAAPTIGGHRCGSVQLGRLTAASGA